MGVAVKRHLFSVEDYYKMAEAGILGPEDRVELIHGQIGRMSPIKSPHAAAVDTIAEELNFLLRGKAIVKVQNPVRFDQATEPQPDVAVVKYVNDRYRSRHPVPQDVYLLIEVADTSLAYDRKVKLPLYAEAGIPCLWIVNLPERSVEVYSGPEGKAYKTKQVFVSGGAVVVQPFSVAVEINQILG